ncbi:MAG: hypothetical protein ACYTFY_06575 [Planctomycetota bacterium]
MSDLNTASLTEKIAIQFPYSPLNISSEQNCAEYCFSTTMVDICAEKYDLSTKYIFRVSNRSMVEQPLKISFKTDKSLSYVPVWLHNPPVYEISSGVKFNHYGLPSRVGMEDDSVPADLPLVVCMDPGTNSECVMYVCESVDYGVGIELSEGMISFLFKDGTDRSNFELEFYEIKGQGLLDCAKNYQKKSAYKGIVKQGGKKMMWFYDTELHYGNDDGTFDIDSFKKDAETVAAMGTEYVVIEPRHHGQHFDARYWSPKMAEKIPEVDFFVKSLDIIKGLGMEPLMYYNCVHGVMRLITHPEYGTPDLYRLRFKPADAGLAQQQMEENMEIDMNWFKDGIVPTFVYPLDSDPVMDVRSAEWRDWLCRRITFMLKTYPQLKGTYIDTWPAGLPIFEESLNEYDACYDKNSWWNAMNDFMWDIRQVTHSFENKIFMLNDSRMPKKVMESADLILNEDAGPIVNAERAFWHCLRSMLVGHGGKPGFQFHHAKPGMRNDDRAKLVMACSAAMGLDYCIIHFDIQHMEDDSDNREAYNSAVSEMNTLLREDLKDISEIVISGESRNIEKLSYSTDSHQVSIDFPGKKLDVKEK